MGDEDGELQGISVAIHRSGIQNTLWMQGYLNTGIVRTGLMGLGEGLHDAELSNTSPTNEVEYKDATERLCGSRPHRGGP